MSFRGEVVAGRRALLGLLGCALLALVLAAPAAADVRRAESILPPGQSGFVSVAGLATGTGSPHLYDQQPLFIDFRRKPAMFGQPGTTTRPRAGVSIVRDRFGVPSIRATSDRLAWWGAGYAVAQDRLFQLEIFRRQATGRLAEILGPDRADGDAETRRDFYTRGEIRSQVRRLPLPLRTRFSAYTDGVNAWKRHVDVTPADQPAEFVALGIPNTPWTVEDSAAIGILLARQVPSGDGRELENVRALELVGARSFDRLLPLRTPGTISTVPASAGSFPSNPGRTRAQERAAYTRSQRFVAGLPLPAVAARAATDASAGRRGIEIAPRPGSGSYVFAARRRDGTQYLYNGPQLGFSMPELFVELELRAPGLRVRGVTGPGIPVLASGHNGRIAWGITSGLSDDDDLYAETVVSGGSQGEVYRFRGANRRMGCRTEIIRISGAPSRSERICRTVHGPVQERAGSTAYARRYAIWMRELATFPGLAAINAADDLDDVARGVRQLTWNENTLAVDSGGRMGYWHPGLLPLRPYGWDERLPVPGDGRAEWRGFLPFSAHPQVQTPARGWLMNWNNNPSIGWTNGDTPALEKATGAYHRGGWLQRVVAALARRPSFAGLRQSIVEAGTIAQQRPLAASRLRAALRGATGGAATALRTILGWDGSYARTNAAGTVSPGVAAWETFKAAAEQFALASLGPPEGTALLAGGTGRSHQFDISNGEAYALRTLSTSQLRNVADLTFAALADRFGSTDPALWREPRAMYDIDVQGVGQPPPLPFFDRGTWEQLVEVAGPPAPITGGAGR